MESHQRGDIALFADIEDNSVFWVLLPRGLVGRLRPPLNMLADRILLALSLYAARHRCNSVRLLTPLPADCYNALNSEFFY
jgi:hypothetical protein